MGSDSAAIAIAEFQLRSVGDMGDQLAIRLRSMRSSSNLSALWPDRHIFVQASQPMAILAITQISQETNQRLISALEDLNALQCTWRSMALSQSATDRHLVEWGSSSVMH